MVSKRGPGEGSIYELPNGKYRGEVMLGYKPDGKTRNRYRCIGSTKEEVRRALRKAKKAYEDGQVVARPRQSVGDYLKGWLEDTVKPTVFARTYVGYRSLIETHAIPAFGRLRLDQLAPPHIQKLIATKAATLAPATVRHLHACLHAAFQHGVDMRVLPFNPCDGVKLPQSGQPRSGSLTPEQGILFFNAAQSDEEYGAFFGVALTTGLREGELYALRWEDVDLATAKLTAQRALSRVHGVGRLEKDTKTHRVRVLPLPPVTVALLQRHWKHQQELRRKAGPLWQDNGLVFTSRIGTAVSERTVSRHFQTILENAKLPRIRLYDLRHSAASIYLALGVPIKDVQVLMGHASATMTLDVYGHSFDEARQEAVRRFGELLTSTGD